MNKKELITQLEHIIETLKEEDVLITRVQVDHMPSYETATGDESYKSYKVADEFELLIRLDHRLMKEVD